ncbi:hypothetical protein DPEC_G00038970 [Dallia pectoralis]|uniref:Uncharacterized protein n=1 Tax=Dallia pectoralis TaxID=75939 RepID=A0ACC2HF55_DALPE|nr:hypothetical protein DPEC_G00038970 [Dallia pectoralis]
MRGPLRRCEWVSAKPVIDLMRVFGTPKMQSRADGKADGEWKTLKSPSLGCRLTRKHQESSELTQQQPHLLHWDYLSFFLHASAPRCRKAVTPSQKLFSASIFSHNTTQWPNGQMLVFTPE